MVSGRRHAPSSPQAPRITSTRLVLPSMESSLSAQWPWPPDFRTIAAGELTEASAKAMMAGVAKAFFQAASATSIISP